VVAVVVRLVKHLHQAVRVVVAAVLVKPVQAVQPIKVLLVGVVVRPQARQAAAVQVQRA
jgi:hypothetical protein